VTALVIVNMENDQSGHSAGDTEKPHCPATHYLLRASDIMGGYCVAEQSRYWAGNAGLRDAAKRAYETGESLDYLLALNLRSFSATSTESLSQRPKIMKSRVTLNRSVSK